MMAGSGRARHPHEDVNPCSNDFKSSPIIIIGLWEEQGRGEILDVTESQ